MVRGICPECAECVEITPTGVAIKPPDSGRYFKPAVWWLVTVHPDKRNTTANTDPCKGSGELV